jgi:NAD(P)-dependent dehydrogenase (short-subunit alcohol dehydrogenase family)
MEELRIDEWNQMVDVNLRGVLHGIAAVLPIMRRQGSGHIINVASVSAHRVDPTAAVYCATKFAVRARVRLEAAAFTRLGGLVGVAPQFVSALRATRRCAELNSPCWDDSPYSFLNWVRFDRTLRRIRRLYTDSEGHGVGSPMCLRVARAAPPSEAIERWLRQSAIIS